MATQPTVKLSLDYSANYLLPLDAAAKIAELLSSAKLVEYGSRKVNGEYVTYDVELPRSPTYTIAPATDALISKAAYEALKAADAEKEVEA